MDDRDVIATLSKLEEMDRDAIGVYQDAIDKTTDARLRDQLVEFRRDHEWHVQAIDRVIREQGWRLTEPTPEFRMLMRGLRDQVDMAEGGDDAVIVALDAGERAMNAEYAEALRMVTVPRVREVLQSDLEDERRHLAFIEQRLPRSYGGGVGVRSSMGAGPTSAER